MIYADNAATSFPKPPCVLEAMVAYAQTAGNPGRSGHRLALASETAVAEARSTIARLIGAREPDRVVFTLNATMALNTAIKGLVRPGDRVLTTAFEHNSVARPLHALGKTGVHWKVVPPSADCPVDLERLETELRTAATKLVVVAHGSNVTGAVVPLAAIRDLAHRYGALVVADTAQTLGHRPVSIEECDVLVFAGHKGLLGPQGTGGLYVGEGIDIRPLVEGGSGGRSERPEQPRWLPYALEAGTPNGLGIAGLAAAVEWLLEAGVALLQAKEAAVRAAFVAGVRNIAGVTVWECASPEPPAMPVSLSVDGLTSLEVAEIVEARHDVLIRGGLHCAPLAHRTLGSGLDGAARFSFSHLTTTAEVSAAVDSVGDVAASASSAGRVHTGVRR